MSKVFSFFFNNRHMCLYITSCFLHKENPITKSYGVLLGYKDSNLEMLESESSALPFGDSPMSVNRKII